MLKTASTYMFKGKFYGTPNNLSVLVHKLHKIIIKWVIFVRKNYFLSPIIIITKFYLPKTSTQ